MKRESTTLGKELTNLVIQYKTTKDQKLLNQIKEKSVGLVYNAFMYYKISSFPENILSEIRDDCQSFVLLKAIEAFDIEKKTEFSTFYTWRLRSHVRSKRGYYMRRGKLVFSVQSMDADRGTASDNKKYNLHSITHNHRYDYREFTEFKKKIAKIFKTT